MSRTTITLKIDQNGGEYYGIAKITLPSPKNISREGNTLIVDDVKIELDEWFEIVSTITS